jgi:hypothetical protein
MNTSVYTIDQYSRDWLESFMASVRRDCRCIKEIQVLSSSPNNACCRVLVTRIDTGVWEWNDEVIA